VRMPAAQGRTDANQSEVIGWYEELYCSVVDLHRLGGGCPDLLVGFSGVNDLVEVKTEEGHLKPSQVTFTRLWRGRKVIVVRNQGDVIKHVQNVRERVSRLSTHVGKE
jgi:hypothetical protein